MGSAARRRAAVFGLLGLLAAAGWWFFRDAGAPRAEEVQEDADPAGHAPVFAPSPSDAGKRIMNSAAHRLATTSNTKGAKFAAGVEVTVEKLDGETRAPTDGTMVTASAPDERERWHTYFELRTGQDGRVQVPSRGASMEVMAVERGFLGDSELVKVPESGAPAPVRLTLRRFATLVVGVHDGAGAPLPNAEVAVTYNGRVQDAADLVDPEDRVWGSRGYLRKTDARGLVVFDGLLPGWPLRVDGPPSAFGAMRISQNLELEAGERRELDVVIDRAVTLRLRLLDWRGAPVHEGEVVLSDMPERGVFTGDWATDHAVEGAVEVTGIPPGRAFALHGTGWDATGSEMYVYEIPRLAALPGQALDLGDLRAADESLAIHVSVEEGSEFPKGSTLELRHVRAHLAEAWIDEASSRLSVLAAPGQSLKFYGLAHGTWTIGFSEWRGPPGGRWEATEVEVPRTGAPLEFLLARRKPAPGEGALTVDLGDPAPSTGWLQFIRDGQTVRVERLRGDGDSEIQVALPPGKYRVLVVAGVQTGAGEVNLEPNGVARLELTLATPAARIRAKSRFAGGGSPFGGQEGKWFLAADWRRSELRASSSSHPWSVASDGWIDQRLPSGVELALVIDGPFGKQGVAIIPPLEPGSVRKDEVVFVEP